MVTLKIKGIDAVLKDIKSQAEKSINEQKEKKIKNLVNDLRNATPVDTGRARDGWYSTENSIENDVEYIDRLNQGTSEQAPPYFVERTLLQPGISPSGIIVKSK